MSENKYYDVELAVMKLARLTRRRPPDAPPQPHHFGEPPFSPPPDGAHPPMPPRGPHHAMRALTAIAENGNPSSRELAEVLDVRPSTLSEMLDRLEHEQLIIRTPDESDKRVSRIALTEKGRETEAVMRARHDAHVAEMSSCFTEEEKEQFCTLCDKLAEHWRRLAQERCEVGTPPMPQ